MLTTPSTPETIVIAGNGVAGLTAGDTLRRLGFTGSLVVVGEEPHRTYSRPALSKSALAPGEELGVNFLPEPAHAGSELLGVRATGLDPRERTLELSDGRRLNFDGLVIATGTRPRRLSDSPRELSLRSLDDAVALRARLAGRPSVTVIGGGALGMEIASGAIGLGCQTTLVHAGTPMRGHIGPFLAERLSAIATQHGLQLIDDTATALTEVGDQLRVSLAGGGEISSEVVITAAGDVPNVDWLAGSGLLRDGRLVTDTRCRVTERIVACGDVAWQGDIRTPIWTSAIEQAKTAAAALLLGDEAPELAFQSYFWTDQWGLNLKISGPIPDDSEEPEIVKGSVESGSFVARWPRQKAAASFNIRMPIPRLHKVARGEA